MTDEEVYHKDLGPWQKIENVCPHCGWVGYQYHRRNSLNHGKMVETEVHCVNCDKVSKLVEERD